MLHAAAVTLVISSLFFVVRPMRRDPSSAERFAPRDGFISPVPLCASLDLEAKGESGAGQRFSSSLTMSFPLLFTVRLLALSSSL